MKSLMKPNEAACYLGLATGTLKKWRLAGKGPMFFKMGRAIRYSQADLDLWLKAQSSKKEEAAPANVPNAHPLAIPVAAA